VTANLAGVVALGAHRHRSDRVVAAADDLDVHLRLAIGARPDHGRLSVLTSPAATPCVTGAAANTGADSAVQAASAYAATAVLERIPACMSVLLSMAGSAINARFGEAAMTRR
jgi:hypothetical protein